ncbi:MAG: HAMP domain-containing protein [Mailhella sp.]|nr:HAMP domain-containing protein [Mailhella sp.]
MDDTPGRLALQPEAEKMRGTRRRTWRELTAATLAGTLFCAGVYWQMSYFGTDSWGFFILLNINVILMLVVLFLVSRSVIKLILERRKKVFGSRLRTRLVLAFGFISFLPILFMFLASNVVMRTSVNYWFTGQFENSMQAAIEVGRGFYDAASERLRVNAMGLKKELESAKPKDRSRRAEKYGNEAGASLLGTAVRGTDGSAAADALWISDAGVKNSIGEITGILDWRSASKDGGTVTLWQSDDADYLIFCSRMDDKDAERYLLVGERVGSGLMNRLRKINQGFEEYSALKELKRPLRLSFTFILGLVSLVVLFGSVWMAFRLSRELTRPVQALSDGADQIARGNLDLHVSDGGNDELGQLAAAFNHMASELRKDQVNLQRLHAQLEERSASLAERNTYIESILERISAGVVTLSGDGTVISMNRSAADILGADPSMWVGKSALDFHAAGYDELMRELREFLAGHSSMWSKETEAVHRGQYRRLLVHAANLPDPKGSIVIVIDDITELTRMQRAAAWRDAARRVAHEIKNPLTPIKLSAERLDRRFGRNIDDPVFGQCTGIIVKEVDRMRNMVSEFSAFAAMTGGIQRRGDIRPVIKEAVELFSISNTGIEWVFDAGDVHDVRFDSEAMYRVVCNILANAADAVNASEKPRKTIYTRCYEDTARHIPGRPPAVAIEVEDNGPGLPEDAKLHIFEPYYSRKKDGTGLGLAIALAVVTDHGGAIDAENAAAGGTRFRIELPLALPDGFAA